MADYRNRKIWSLNGSNKLTPIILGLRLIFTVLSPIDDETIGGALGGSIRNVLVDDMKTYLGHELIGWPEFDKVGIAFDEFVKCQKSNQASLKSCSKSLGGLIELKYVELMMRAELADVNSGVILTKIFDGCAKLRLLAIKGEFIWSNTGALENIEKLKPIKELS